MNEWLGTLIAVTVAFVGGNGSAELLRIMRDWRNGKTEKQRDEVAIVVAELQATRAERDRAIQERDAARERARDQVERYRTHRRKLLEHLSHTRRVAYDHGVPFERLPPIELGD